MKTTLIPPVKQISLGESNIYIGNYYFSEAFGVQVPVAREILEENFELVGQKPIEFICDKDLKEEAYELEIKETGITVKAASETGAYYAIATLLQLLQINDGQIKCCKITDEPTLKLRGFSDDISRGQISTKENFKSIIRRLSLCKCNVYMPYIEDTIKFDCIPESGKYSDAMAKEEWVELVNYAKRYYVKVIPIINILGHWDKNASLAYFREYMLKEKGKVTPDLDATQPGVREMVAEILKEAVEIFGEHGYIHVGGDEVGAYTREFGKEEAGNIYNGHYQFAYEELKKQGQSMMLYSDMYTPIWGDYQIGIDRIEEMPKDLTFVYWDYGYRKHYKNIDDLIQRNIKFIVSPATYTWNRCLPHPEVAFMNTKMLAGQSPEHYEGLLMSAWCDGGMTLREENWYGILCGALFAWEPTCEVTFDEYTKMFYEIYYGMSEVDLEKFHKLFDYDKGYGLEDLNEVQGIGNKLFAEFWKDARLPVDETLKVGLEGALESLEEALDYFKSLAPTRNMPSYEVQLFDIQRLIANIKKVELLKSTAYSSREEAMEDIPKINALVEEIEVLREENKRLWFASNRQSEWEFAECKYLDLLDSLRSLGRYCKVGKKLEINKML